MKTFEDSTGVTWTFDINLESIELVKTVCKIDLSTLFDRDLAPLNRLFEEPAFLADVLWVLCGTKSGDRSAFRRAMKGDFLEAAANALVGDVIDFFPNARKRQSCLEILAKIQEASLAGLTVLTEELTELNPLEEIRKKTAEAKLTLLPSVTDSAA